MGFFRRGSRRSDGDGDGVPDPDERPLAAAPGELPEDGAATVGDVDLPPGRRHRAALSQPDGPVVLWATDAPPSDPFVLWSALADAFPETGLWPVFLEAPAGELDLDTPAEGWEEQVERDAEETLLALWAEATDDPDDFEDDMLAPVGAAFPGLGTGRPSRIDGTLEVAADSMERIAALALVPVTRPADVLAALGWTGPVNWIDDPATLSVVLRSWEERYDTIVVGLGFDTLFLGVRRPAEGDDALQAAAEQYAFCPDTIEQGALSLRALADGLDGAVAWAFWWD